MDTETIVLGGGCFWCTEAVFQMLKGVVSVKPGYAGPMSSTPVTYEKVSSGTTPYVEVIEVVYEPEHIAFEEILRVFFASHDGTELNRQGADVGPQYASAIFCTTERQKEKSEHYIAVLNKSGFVKPIVTRVEMLQSFYPAEDYHNNYFKNNSGAGYCQLVIAPKVEKIEKTFKSLVK